MLLDNSKTLSNNRNTIIDNAFMLLDISKILSNDRNIIVDKVFMLLDNSKTLSNNNNLIINNYTKLTNNWIINPEKVVFGFFIVMSLTLNFGFCLGEIDNPDYHNVYEAAAIFVNSEFWWWWVRVHTLLG